jgi:ABC-type nickel/cobalt efflux system permease component RcnA
VLVVAAAGLVAGLTHVLAGPDHLAAVAPLAADTDRRRWRAGFSWGIGHTSGVLVVGTLALLLRQVLPIDAISSWSERLVGVALIAVGLWSARRALRVRVHTHEHAHDGSTHAHLHFHDSAAAPHRAARSQGLLPHRHTHTSFAFGILHGLAGSAHILGILPALALPTQSDSATYLVAYGTGNIAAMTVFASAIGAAAGRSQRGGPHVYRALLCACSLAAFVTGGIWLIS